MWYEDVMRFLEELMFVKVTDFAASLKPRHKNYEGMFNGDFEVFVVTDKDKQKKVKEIRIKESKK